MKKILLSIGKGIINGFPLIQSIVKNVKGAKGTLKEIPLQPTIDNLDRTEKQPFDIVSIITELIVFVLIVTFCLGKLKIDDLKSLIDIIK